MSWVYIIGFILAFCLSLIITPIIKRIAPHIGALDNPNSRKVHHEPIPRLGGVAIFSSFSIVYICIVYFTDAVATNVGYAILLGGLIIVITGILDDIFTLSAKLKIVGQLIAAFVAIYFGLEIQVLDLPFFEGDVHIGWIGIPLTLLWILAITNALNLIDGLDGLAAGVSCISSIAMFFVSLSLGNHMMAFMLLFLIGSILGFLPYNFNPASIFMGDSGSLFLGYFLSVISLLELKEVTTISIVIPMLVLAVPISDTVYAIIRRKLNRQPISMADKNHLHHRLLALGFSHRTTVIIIYAISIIFAFLGIVSTKVTLWILGVFLLIYVLFFQIFAEFVGMMKKEHRPLLIIYQKIKTMFKAK